MYTCIAPVGMYRYCPNRTSLLCSRCACASYCSSECQRRDWRHHRDVCFPALEDRLRGRALRAIKHLDPSPRLDLPRPHRSHVLSTRCIELNTLIGENKFHCTLCQLPVRSAEDFDIVTVECLEENYAAADDRGAETTEYYLGEFRYGRCWPCAAENRELCVTSFRPVDLCVEQRRLEFPQLYLRVFYWLCDALECADVARHVIALLHAISLQHACCRLLTHPDGTHESVPLIYMMDE